MRNGASGVGNWAWRSFELCSGEESFLAMGMGIMGMTLGFIYIILALLSDNVAYILSGAQHTGNGYRATRVSSHHGI
eukprot:jgi/Botrbrau1/19470/Bobra.0338s0087.1